MIVSGGPRPAPGTLNELFFTSLDEHKHPGEIGPVLQVLDDRRVEIAALADGACVVDVEARLAGGALPPNDGQAPTVLEL